jgi:hypothetical protein
MTRRGRAAIAAALIGGVAAAGAGAERLIREDERWPPAWYVDPATNRAAHAALRRRAVATPQTEFPPRDATLAYLRNLAVGAASDRGERVDAARVYLGNGYTLQLRGKFSTAYIGPAPPGRRPPRRFAPCLTLGLDPSTLFAISVSLGKCEELSFLGESVELDLGEEPR